MLRELSWLPRPQPDFAVRCRELCTAPQGAGVLARALASSAMGGNDLQRLGRAVRKAQESGVELRPLAPFRLAIVGNGTLDFLPNALIATAARYGFSLQCEVGNYDQVLPVLLDPDSPVNRFKPDAVLIAVDHRALPWRPSPGGAGAADTSVEMACNFVRTARDAVRAQSSAVCILQNLAPPPETLFGSFERRVPGALASLIDAFNQKLIGSVLKSDDILLDVAHIASAVGLESWHSHQEWNLAKLPFSSDYIPLYADHVLRLIAAIRGKSRRCLILDLDNTVWGGVIGDDGLEGIRVAQGDAVGEAHLAVQQLALNLRERGIVLAVSSKNDDEVARAPFRNHPEMLLKEDHIAVFQANWRDKATNIKAISEELSLGLESMVFLDDNPVERGLVRAILPEVAVPEVGDDPATFAPTLAAAGYFDIVVFSDEDKKRAALYQDNARRVALQQQAGDVQSYLASLDMEVIFRPFDNIGRSRISQLINKSNQYNLTTRRYSELDVAKIEQDDSCVALQVRLTDRFGDNGMISVVICRPDAPDVWRIDTWLMSCRVLGRGVENAVLAEVVRLAQARGVTALVGDYIPTDRNGMVRDHYEKLGFDLVSQDEAGASVWRLATDRMPAHPPMRVRREGLS